MSTPILRRAAVAAAMTLVASSALAYKHAPGASTQMLRAEASLPSIYDVAPLIVAGDPGGTPTDNPTLRIDPNLASSPWSGVVSLNIRYSTGTVGSASSFICSGALVSDIHIVTAAHCIDTGPGNGTGTPIVIGDRLGGVRGVGDVRAVFNSQTAPGAANTFTLGSAVSVSMHSDYKGFGVCPPGTSSDEFCINDDIAVITLGQAAPSWMTRYAVGPMPGMGTQVTHVGFGTTGNGVTGHQSGSSSFFIKRTGRGHIDRPLDELNDEQGFAGPAEVWVADFDNAALGIDRHCTDFGVCSAILGNDVETTLGGGDSGGPSFVRASNGQWLMVGNNTYSRRFFNGQVGGTFGTAYGGMILESYVDFLEKATGGAVQVVPEPQTYALMALGLLGVGAVARRRKAAKA